MQSIGSLSRVDIARWLICGAFVLSLHIVTACFIVAPVRQMDSGVAPDTGAAEAMPGADIMSRVETPETELPPVIVEKVGYQARRGHWKRRHGIIQI